MSQQQQKSLILVTGASGQVGSTGYHTIINLVQHGYRVRALVRNLDGRSARLSAIGQPGDVEIFKGDMLDYSSVREAVKGVKRIYFCFPVREGIVQATIIMARAAKEEGIKGVVNISSNKKYFGLSKSFDGFEKRILFQFLFCVLFY